jgi:glycogen(starch) synthase
MMPAPEPPHRPLASSSGFLRALRICVVTREYRGVTAYTGGVGTTFALLAPRLVEAGHDVHVVTSGELLTRARVVDGVRIHHVPRRIPGRLWVVEDVWWTHQADRMVRAVAPDLVFAAEWRGEAWRYARWYGRGRVVTHLTTSIEQIRAITRPALDPQARARYAIQARLERSQTEHSDGVIASSNAILRWARELWSFDDVPQTVIPNFVDVDGLGATARGGTLPEGFPAEGPTVLFFGRLEARKGVDVLASAMPRVWERFPDTRFVLVGGDQLVEGTWMSERIRTLAGDGDRVHVLGNHPPERLFPAVAAADVVVFPSRWENLSLATLEARALGKPTIATTGSGFDDIYEGDDGLLVAPGEDEPLADAIARLLADDQLRRRLGERAAVIESARADVVVRDFLRFFERVSA